jgi:hypothetical protein
MFYADSRAVQTGQAGNVLFVAQPRDVIGFSKISYGFEINYAIA